MKQKLVMAMAAAFALSALSSPALWGFGEKSEEKAEATVEVAADLTPVESSLLKAVKYDEAAKVLTVQMVEGEVYEYADVPKNVFDELMSADSKGSYFVSNIKEKFQAMKK